MPRLIDADTVMRLIPYEEFNAKMVIANVPTIDAVTVVRCKDCVYFDKSYRPIYSGWCRYLMSTNGDIVTYHGTTEQDFCSRGIRREDETD